MNNQIDIRDQFLDLESLSDSNDFKNLTDEKMLKFFTEMSSEFEFIEFERWLIDE